MFVCVCVYPGIYLHGCVRGKQWLSCGKARIYRLEGNSGDNRGTGRQADKRKTIVITDGRIGRLGENNGDN